MDRNIDDTQELYGLTPTIPPTSFKVSATPTESRDPEPLSLTSMAEIMRTFSTASKALTEQPTAPTQDINQHVLLTTNLDGKAQNPVSYADVVKTGNVQLQPTSQQTITPLFHPQDMRPMGQQTGQVPRRFMFTWSALSVRDCTKQSQTLVIQIRMLMQI